MYFILIINIILCFKISIFAPEIALLQSKHMKTLVLETLEKVNTKKDRQQIQLVKGAFSTSEASDIIWEGSHGCQTSQLDGRIRELEEEKRVAREFIAQVRESGRNLKISGTLEITLAD